jgi:radical SAM protein with 4Fe4S-binding SPASM domain
MATYVKNGIHRKMMEALSDDAFFLKYGFTKAPELIQWMITLKCPLKCRHCLAASSDALKEMPLEKAASLIEEISSLGVNELLISGGEPLSRPDFPEIVNLLHKNRISWSLNTAVMPDSKSRQAIEKWPPGFVAVSLDGPPEVHNSFRGYVNAFRDALESISYFSGVVPENIVAGTTVTSENFDYLPETFGIVIESKASAWGLHLLVPEGRALNDKNLFLSREQLKKLLRFAAAKKNHFPVNIADEIGYCGSWEPLVRDYPLSCGAGKAQCVILPDGEVVPCTTLDKSVSAGNVHDKPLREIWETGFSALRNYSPQGKCAKCDYAIACKGGCWLQRRHGTECFKDIWHMPKALATPLGIAVCLGLSAAGYSEEAKPAENGQGEKPAQAQQAEEKKADKFDKDKIDMLHQCIIKWYAYEFGGSKTPTEKEIKDLIKANIPDDPASKYLLSFINKERPKDIVAISKQIEEALKTKLLSLNLISLAWQDVMEWRLNKENGSEITKEEREVLRNLMALLGKTADNWRQVIFEKKIDPFLWRRIYRPSWGWGKKSLPPPDYARTAEQQFESEVARERGWSSQKKDEELLKVHPYADGMILSFESNIKSGLQKLSRGEKVPADNKMGVFDLLIVPQQKESEQIKLTFKNNKDIFNVLLPPNTELTYGDILCLTYEQNKEALNKLVLKIGISPYYLNPLFIPLLNELWKKSEKEGSQSNLRWSKTLLLDLYLF